MATIRRILLVASILMAASFSARAQSVDTRPMWGVRAALDINLPGSWHFDSGSVEMYRHGVGFTAGAVYNVWLGKGFYLEPGVSFFYDTYSYKDLIINEENGEKDPSLYKLGLRIPVMVGYDIGITDSFDFYVYTGPEISYALKGEVRVKDKTLFDKSELSLFGEDGSMYRADLAWKVGVGFPFGDWLLSVDGAFGLTDLNRSPNITFRENRATIAVTRYF